MPAIPIRSPFLPAKLTMAKSPKIVANGTEQKESEILRNYFKRQGLSQEEMSAAINVYKEEKAKNTPDLNEIQSQLAQAQKAALTAEIQRAGTLEAITMGIDVKTAPYILKNGGYERSYRRRWKAQSGGVEKTL